VEIMANFYGRCSSVSSALQYIDVISSGRPMFAEETIGPGDAKSMAAIAAHSLVLIATGERLVDRKEFDEFFSLRAVHIAQPDPCHVGGFTEARKTASAAETAGVGIASHNPLGPLARVAALHFAIATSNFLIQKEMSGAVPWSSTVMDSPIEMKDGFWQIPHKPGLGIEIHEAEAELHPFEQEFFHSRHA